MRSFLALIFFACIALFQTPQLAHAQVADPRVAKVSFTFDDGLATHINSAAPTLRKYGITGTEYVATGCVGMTKVPNTCRASKNHVYMTWNQLTTLRNTYGWEIAAHTVTHPLLASKNASDGQPNVLTSAQVTNELTKSKADLASHGFITNNMASPYGDYSYQTIAELSKYYSSHRGFWDQNTNSFPYNESILNVKQVQGGVTVAQVNQAIDQAIANKQWLILVFHEIKNNPSTKTDAYEYSPKDLELIASYVQNKQKAGLIKPVSINQALTITQPNLLPDGSFTNGITGGWTADSSSVVRDTGTNGSFPSPKDSVSFNGAVQAGHLFTPAVAANPSATYAFKAFANTLGKTAGEFGFYVDEYDAANNWISGQWLGAIWLPSVSYFTANFTPTSAAVKTFQIETYLSANSGGKVFADNYQLYNLNGTQPTITPTPIPTATPKPTQTPTKPAVTPSVTPKPTLTTVPTPTAAPVNLVTNGSFELVSSGFASSWTKDSESFTLDSTSNGNNGTNSIKLSPNVGDSHVFSSLIPVDARSTYKWRQYIKAPSGGGEFGFYIDEYDASGNWVTGQWKGLVNAPFTGTKEFTYEASLPMVTSVGLQYYAVPNSSFTLYIDSVFFGK